MGVPSESNMMRIIFLTLAAATFVLGAPVAQEPDALVAYETSGQRRMLTPQEDTPGDIEFKNRKEEGIFRVPRMMMKMSVDEEEDKRIPVDPSYARQPPQAPVLGQDRRYPHQKLEIPY